MVTYRYSEDGIERLARKATHLSLVILSIAFLGGLTLLWVNGELRGPLPEIVVVGTLLGTLIGASLFLTWRKSVRINRTIAKSTEVELDQDALTARSSLGTTKLGRNEVTEIRYMKDGILVRGANRRHMVHSEARTRGVSGVGGKNPGPGLGSHKCAKDPHIEFDWPFDWPKVNIIGRREPRVDGHRA